MGKRHIPVPTGEEINRESVSSGERTRKSLNRWHASVAGVVGPHLGKAKPERSAWKGAPQKVTVL